MHGRFARSRSRNLFGYVALIFLLASCTSASAPAKAPGSPVAAKATATPAAPTVLTPNAAEDLLVLRQREDAEADGYAVIEARTGQVIFTLPQGAISDDWHTLVELDAGPTGTAVRVRDAEGGSLRREIDVPGTWRLPRIGVGQTPGGLSADGSTLVLEDAARTSESAASAQTKFAIVPTNGSIDPRIVTLKGSFTYDALSPDGGWLYLLQHLAGADPTHYAVRRLNVASGHLEDGSILDKRNVDEVMAGYAVSQLSGNLGWVYTLYRGHDGAFIHALSTVDGIAFCIDLPGSAGTDEATASGWGLALSPSGDELVAANGLLGIVSDVDLETFSVVRTSTLAAGTWIDLAKFESARPAGGSLALSEDGSTLYAVGRHGVIVVRGSDLVTIRTLDGGHAYVSVAAGSSGAVYAVRDDGRAVVLGTDGEPDLVIAGDQYAGIAAVVPLR